MTLCMTLPQAPGAAAAAAPTTATFAAAVVRAGSKQGELQVTQGARFSFAAAV